MENDPAQLRAEAVAPLLNPESKVEYYDAKLDWITERFGLRKVAQALYPYAQKAYRGMDWLGGKFAHGLGLTQSRFQYAVDEYNRRERKFNEREAAERERQRQLRHQANLVDEDDSRLPYVPPVSLIFVSSPTGSLARNNNNNNNTKSSAAASSPSSFAAASAPSAVPAAVVVQQKVASAAKKGNSKNGQNDDDDDADEQPPHQNKKKLEEEMRNL